MKAFLKLILTVVLLYSTAARYGNCIDIDKLLQTMTNEEKCGQMTQVDLGVAVKDGSIDPNENPIDILKLRYALIEKKIGSFLTPAPLGVTAGEKWQQIVRTIQQVAINETTSKIPILLGIDSIHGATFIRDTVLYPQPISMAASFNEEIARIYGKIVAKEQRAAGFPWNFSPIMDVGRNQLWPRLWETMGEDVYLASKMATAYIRGHEGSSLKNTTTAASCLKHYVGYSLPFNGLDRTPAYIPENVLREFFLPTFEAGIKAGALTVMVNSGYVNGIPGHANYRYLTEILKQELGLKGFAVSDWTDVKRLNFRDHIAATPEDAVRIAVMAGLDMSMVPGDFSFYDYCVDWAKKDEKFVERITDAARRILYVKNALGLFENPFPNPEDLKNIGTVESHNFNRDATRETIVLVKNEKNILPLEKENLKILVTGPTANLLRVLNSGWSYGWQGDDESAYTKFGKYNLTLFDAINNINKQKNVKFSEGANLTQLTNLAQTIEEAKNSDIIILGIGEDVYAETPGNIYDMNLPKHQFQLADALFELNKPVIVVYFGGRPRVFTRIAEKANAILIGFLPGPRGPEAISDILFGDYNPDGRLPVTYPKSRNGLFTYDYKNLESQQNTDFNCLYPFGHGLSYTTFEYSDLSFSTKNVKASEGLTVTVNVTNTGNRSGKHSVLLYLTDDYASVSRPNKQLKGFKKISLDPGSSQLVQFQLGQEDFSFPNLKNQKIYELGSFTVRVGNLTDTFDLVA